MRMLWCMVSLFKSFNRKKKDNLKLRSMNQEIKVQSEEISQQHDMLEEKNGNLDVLNSKLVDEMAERESIEQSSFARDRFLATMAHEMRTPMNIITGLTHLLLEEAQNVVFNLQIGMSLDSTCIFATKKVVGFSKI